METDTPSRTPRNYVLVTAARNEEDYIAQTIASVADQTILPVRWVIVSDGSTDATETIVREEADRHPFIQLVEMEDDKSRDFGGKAQGIDAGMHVLEDVDFEYVGVIDADVTLAEDYYERAMMRFEEDPDLGLVGGVRFDNCNGEYKEVLANAESAGGPTQFFRRECFEQTGGYLALPMGGVDAVAEASAKMHGWSVKMFRELKVWHHRRTGTEKRSIFGARFHQGVVDRSLGYHPLFMYAKSLYRIREQPLIVGGLLRAAGFTWATLRGDQPQVPNDLKRFLRRDQLRRLNPFAKRKLWSTPPDESVASIEDAAAAEAEGGSEGTGPYVLVTSARNEEDFIGKTAASVCAQSLSPARWIVVSDGSTDRTDEIIESYARDHPFITVVRVDGEDRRDFGGKIRGIERAIETLADTEYEYIGIVDADLTIDPHYYARAIPRFEADSALGLIGGTRFDNCDGKYRKVLMSGESAGGPTQLFRRACYEQIGGYLMLPLGGEDAAAEAAAKMHGWKVRRFEDLIVYHHRRTGTESRGILKARFHQGVVDRSLGYHPLFAIMKSVFRLREDPIILGGIMRGMGYTWAVLRGDKPVVPPDLVAFVRTDQLRRLNPFDTRRVWSPARHSDSHGGS